MFHELPPVEPEISYEEATNFQRNTRKAGRLKFTSLFPLKDRLKPRVLPSNSTNADLFLLTLQPPRPMTNSLEKMILHIQGLRTTLDSKFFTTNLYIKVNNL